MQEIIKRFGSWLNEAITELGEEHAITVCVATANKQGIPSARMVLLKKYDERGFVFFTNFNSRKGGELLENPYAAMCFYWQKLNRQLRIEGEVEEVTKAEADEYFNSRHPRSRVGAIVSKQSEQLLDYEGFVSEVDRLEGAFKGNEIPRPENWSGFRIKPVRIEFWQAGENRLHKRWLYEKDASGNWCELMLYP